MERSAEPFGSEFKAELLTPRVALSPEGFD
jgi:hypothetical protein